MKKAFTVIFAVTILLLIILIPVISVANSNTNNQIADKNVISEKTQGELAEMKEKSEKQIDDYVEKYGSKPYGITAYILNIVRIYSIPLCFLGIAISAIYRYTIGIRRFDAVNQGMGMLIFFITILIVCQVLPLIFAVVVKGWR